MEDYRTCKCGFSGYKNLFRKDRSECKSCVSEKMKKYLKKNNEKINLKQKLRYQENREQQLAKNKERRKINGKTWNENRRKKNSENPLINMLRTAKMRAKKKGIEFSILERDLFVPEFCPALGIPLKVSETGICSDNSPSIDRIDNSKGYVKGNVIVVSFKANTIKNNATIEELNKVSDYYKNLVKNDLLRCVDRSNELVG